MSRGLTTVYRPDTKWGPDLIYQVPQTLLLSSFVKYVRMAK